MPYIFISAVALCANLYRCAPLIVGDKYADPDVMRFLGAKITTDYPEPNSPPMYVMFATMRSVMDALQEIGYELNSSQVVQGYTTWIMSKPAESDPKLQTALKSDSAVNAERSTDEIQREPEVTAATRPRKKNKAVETEDRGYRHCFELTPKESAELRSTSSNAMRRGRAKEDGYSSRDTSFKRLPRTESEYARTESQRQRRPVSDIDESTSTRDLQSKSSKRLVASESGVAKDPYKRQIPEAEDTNRGRKDLQDSSSKEERRYEPPKGADAEQHRTDLEPKESRDDPETKLKTAEGSAIHHRKPNKWSKSNSDIEPPEKTKHRGTKAAGRKSSTPVKENFKQ